jgi:hypothetical protein
MTITVDLDKVAKWVDESKDLILTPDAEKSLKNLLDLQEQIDLAIKQAKENIKTEALAYNENFSSLKTDNFKVSYRAYGARYTIERSHADMIPKDLTKSVTKLSVNIKAVDEYLENNDGMMPLGINETERVKQISIKAVA